MTSSPLILGRYSPIRPLGLDDPSAVWLARDERTGQDVALKMFERDENLGRAVGGIADGEREAEVARRLNHERCVQALDFAADADRDYIVYEYLPSSNLAERLASLTLGEIVEVLAQVCEGLAHAHSVGIVHRDVKPTNILIEDGPQIAVRIVDFEKAQIDGLDTFPRTSIAPGALPFIAPEVVRRKAATGKADVWCVGLILRLAAVGLDAFEGLGRAIPIHRDGETLPVSTRDFTQRERRLIEDTILAGIPPVGGSCPRLPRRLTAAIDASLAIYAAKRPTAAQLAEELHAVVGEAQGRQ